MLLDTPHGQLRVASDVSVRHGQRVEVYVRPEDVSLSDSGAALTRDDTTGGAWRGVVAADEYQGPHWDCLVEVDGRRLKVRLYRHPGEWGQGQSVGVSVDGDRAFIMTADEGAVDDEAGGAPPGVVAVKARTNAQEPGAVLDGSGVA